MWNERDKLSSLTSGKQFCYGGEISLFDSALKVRDLLRINKIDFVRGFATLYHSEANKM